MKSRKRLLLAAAALLGIVALVGCDFFVQVVLTNRLAGRVVDARLSVTGTGVSGLGDVVVTLYASDGTTQVGTSTTSGSDGSFSFLEVDPGSYVIKGTRLGYAFIDKAVNVSARDSDVAAGDVLGFGSGTTDISIITTWSGSFSDVDSHITYPTADNWGTNQDPVFTDLYQDQDPGLDALTGFFPTSTLSDRERVYHGVRTSTSTVGDFSGVVTDTTPAVTLDVDDVDGSGPETITIKAPPVPASSISYRTPSSAAIGLPSGSSYAWIGVMEFYVNSFSTPSLATEGVSGGASVVVYVVQGSSVEARIVVPDYILIETASVLRINLFVRQSDNTAFYQFVPDVRIVGNDTYKGLGNNGPIVLAGAAR